MHRDDAEDYPPPTDFRQDISGEQLLIRYARGRTGHFANRQVLTLMGGFVLAVMNGPVAGLGVVLIALLGEALDCLYLRTVPARLERGTPVDRIRRISTATAGIQAMTIAVCVAFSLSGGTSHASPLFAMAFLAGAAVNAGLVLPVHKPAAAIRLVVYALSVGAFLVSQALVRGPTDTDFLMNAVGTLILGYMVYMFLLFVVRGSRRNRRNLAALTAHREELEETNRQLVLHQKEAHQLALVARNANDSVVVCDADGRITWVNHAFTRITGYGLHEALRQRPGDLLNGPDTSAETIAQLNTAVSQGAAFRGELQNITKHGALIWIETNQVPVLAADGSVEMVIAIERDITQAKQSARDLAEAKVRAEEGARAKADFLATMSHEIRTPMNGVIGMADLICETELNADQRVFAETIRTSAQALLAIINDILDLSKLDARKMTLSPVDFDVAQCLNDTVQLLTPQARDKGLDLTLDIASDVPARARADDGRIRQVLINLIGNAVKFTEIGSVRVDVRSAAPGQMSVDVHDTGIGIPPDMVDQVFERFSQAESTTTRRFGGTGLGLTISRLLVEAMGGSIRVSSTPGQGSCFGITVPLAAPLAVAEHNGDPRPVAARLDVLTGKRVLVAEDNKVNRLLIRKYLRDVPMDLVFAHDGQQAVDLVRTQTPDIVFMDMSMPVMNGIEATHLIRKAPHRQPAIVALTANAFDSDRLACLQAGMDGFLTKPLRRDDLLAAMIRHCAPAEHAGQV